MWGWGVGEDGGDGGHGVTGFGRGAKYNNGARYRRVMKLPALRAH